MQSWKCSVNKKRKRKFKKISWKQKNRYGIYKFKEAKMTWQLNATTDPRLDTLLEKKNAIKDVIGPNDKLENGQYIRFSLY